MNRIPSILPLALALALAACGDEPEEAAGENGRSAAGEVLEGSISDEMLPYDRVRSQPPLMEMVEDADGEAPGGGSATPGAGPASPAPAPADEAADETPEAGAAPVAD